MSIRPKYYQEDEYKKRDPYQATGNEIRGTNHQQEHYVASSIKLDMIQRKR